MVKKQLEEEDASRSIREQRSRSLDDLLQGVEEDQGGRDQEELDPLARSRSLATLSFVLGLETLEENQEAREGKPSLDAIHEDEEQDQVFPSIFSGEPSPEQSEGSFESKDSEDSIPDFPENRGSQDDIWRDFDEHLKHGSDEHLTCQPVSRTHSANFVKKHESLRRHSENFREQLEIFRINAENFSRRNSSETTDEPEFQHDASFEPDPWPFKKHIVTKETWMPPSLDLGEESNIYENWTPRQDRVKQSFFQPLGLSPKQKGYEGPKIAFDCSPTPTPRSSNTSKRTGHNDQHLQAERIEPKPVSRIPTLGGRPRSVYQSNRNSEHQMEPPVSTLRTLSTTTDRRSSSSSSSTSTIRRPPPSASRSPRTECSPPSLQRHASCAGYRWEVAM